MSDGLLSDEEIDFRTRTFTAIAAYLRRDRNAYDPRWASGQSGGLIFAEGTAPPGYDMGEART